jgi:3-methyl-2-oxobutanoate hydroxymethyltransferase
MQYLENIKEFVNKKNKEKIVCLTAYSYSIAKIIDNYCDLILVGDSLGMTLYGMKDTVDVTLDMMINHGSCVRRAAKKSLIVVDLPYGTYEDSPKQALESAQKILSKTQCHAIKIEVNEDILPTIKYLHQNQIPIMGHVGLLPQHVRRIGGYKYQGIDEKSANKILEIAKKIEEYGAFSLVIEAVTKDLADKITKSLKIPTIGIGASINCDGQILVTDDLIGLNQEFKPKFVKHYDNFSDRLHKAAQNYCDEIKNNKFPEEIHMLITSKSLKK